MEKLRKISVRLVAVMVFATTLFLNVEQKKDGTWRFIATSVKASDSSTFSDSGNDSGSNSGWGSDGEEEESEVSGPTGGVGTLKVYWHPNSTVISDFAKLTPSNPESSSVTSYGGELEVASGTKVKVGAKKSKSVTYLLTTTHFECSFSFTSPECYQKEEYTLYSWTK